MLAVNRVAEPQEFNLGPNAFRKLSRFSGLSEALRQELPRKSLEGKEDQIEAKLVQKGNDEYRVLRVFAPRTVSKFAIRTAVLRLLNRKTY